jgi:hypothetical protein
MRRQSISTEKPSDGRKRWRGHNNMVRTIPIPEDAITADALEMILKYEGHFNEDENDRD